MMIPQFQRSRHGQDFEWTEFDSSGSAYRNRQRRSKCFYSQKIKVCVLLLLTLIFLYLVAALFKYLTTIPDILHVESKDIIGLNNCESTTINGSDDACVYELSLEYTMGAPDGVTKQMLTFNGQFPGPTLRCARGKFLMVRVTNNLDEPTSVHWHGIEQNLSPFFDGPEGVTQCPIVPGTSMLYRFQLFQAGTYWYHSHHSQQYVEGAWGVLIIDNTNEVWGHLYDEEMTITLNDWHHLPAKTLHERFMVNDADFPIPDSLLINGKASYNCTQAILDGKECNSQNQTPLVISVRPGRRYRVRVINTSASSRFEFSIDGHQLEVIEADGVDTVRVPPVDKAYVWTAQRYSFILTTNVTTRSDFWIRIVGIFNFKHSLAVLHYERNNDGNQDQVQTPNITQFAERTAQQGRPEMQNFDWKDMAAACNDNSKSKQKKCSLTRSKQLDKLSKRTEMSRTQRNVTDIPNTNQANTTYPVLLNQNDCRPFHNDGESSAPDYYDRLITINAHDCVNVTNTVNSVGKSRTRLCLNEIQYIPGTTDSIPILFQMIEGKNISSSIAYFHTPNLDEVVQVVINNQNKNAHPWHLHGHTFWVVGTGAPGQGNYNPTRDAGSLSTAVARRDTTHTFEFSWTVIRYVTGNPGSWFLHCHISWHLGAGFGAAVIEGEYLARQLYCNAPKEAVDVCQRAGVQV